MTTRFALGAALATGLFVCTPPAIAAKADAIDASSKVDEVLIYSTRARVFRLASATLTTGEQRVRIATLPTSVDTSSVNVTCDSARVERVEVDVTRGRLPRQAEAEKLADQIELLDDRRRTLREEHSLLNSELSFVRSLRLQDAPRNPRRALPVEGIFFDSWRKILRWVDARTKAIEARTKVLGKEREALRKQRHKLVVKAQDLDLASVTRPMLTVTATVKARAGKHTLKLSYLVPNVSWRPSYDLRYDHLKNRVEATYYAMVSQRSGEDWTNARLRFSTARPMSLVAIPELATWTLGRKRDFTPRPSPRYERQPRRWRPSPPRARISEQVSRLRRLVRSDALTESRTGVALGTVGRGALGRGAGGSRRAYKRPLRSKRRYDRRRSRYKSKKRLFDRERLAHRAPQPSVAPPPAPPAEADDATDQLQNMSMGGKRSARSRMSRPGRRQQKERLPWTEQGYRPPYLPPNSPAAAAKGFLFTLYAPGRHDVPSSYKKRRVPVLRTSFAVKPVHRLVPGRSKSAYVLAEFKNNTGRPILRGHANLFTGSMFSGRSFINTALPGHTLSLPLGVDDSVKVVRHLSQRTVTQGVLFRDDVTEYTVALEVANHRRRRIRIDLRDQIPIAQGKKVEIKAFSCFTSGKKKEAAEPTKDRKAGWTKPDDQGRVVWIGDIGPGKVRKLKFTFRIVRPKDWMLRQYGG